MGFKFEALLPFLSPSEGRSISHLNPDRWAHPQSVTIDKRHTEYSVQAIHSGIFQNLSEGPEIPLPDYFSQPCLARPIIQQPLRHCSRAR